MKTQTMSISQFMSGEWRARPALAKPAQGLREVGRVIQCSAGTLALVIPEVVFASPADTSSTFDNVWNAVMNAFDCGVVLVIVFAGAAWSLGHRSKAIEILIGVCCGYILARHAKDIRDFLKGI